MTAVTHKANPRQLHIEESVDSITYNDTEMTVDHFEPKAGEEIVMESCPFFTTTLMEIEGTTTLKLAERDSFSVVISTAETLYYSPDGSKTILNQGETVLVPHHWNRST